MAERMDGHIPLELHRTGLQNDAATLTIDIINKIVAMIKIGRSVSFHTNYSSYHLLHE